MKAVLGRLLAGGLSLGVLAILTGCAAAVYDGGPAVYGVDYYEPYGYVYGHWHEGYRVGPPRGHEEHHIEAHASRPAYRPAPAGHSAPSIPSRTRSH